MAELTRFCGIVIAMFYREHGRAHIHVFYSGDVVIIDANDGSVIVGKIPLPALRLVQEWVSLHRDELLEAWKKARRGEPVGKMRPLK